MNTLVGIAASLLVGVLLFLKAETIGSGFCKVGRAIWKVGTFGLTDMKAFYQEAHARIVFRIFGVVLVVGSLVFACISVYRTLSA